MEQLRVHIVHSDLTRILDTYAFQEQIDSETVKAVRAVNHSVLRKKYGSQYCRLLWAKYPYRHSTKDVFEKDIKNIMKKSLLQNETPLLKIPANIKSFSHAIIGGTLDENDKRPRLPEEMLDGDWGKAVKKEKYVFRTIRSKDLNEQDSNEQDSKINSSDQDSKINSSDQVSSEQVSSETDSITGGGFMYDSDTEGDDDVDGFDEIFTENISNIRQQIENMELVDETEDDKIMRAVTKDMNFTPVDTKLIASEKAASKSAKVESVLTKKKPKKKIVRKTIEADKDTIPLNKKGHIFVEYPTLFQVHNKKLISKRSVRLKKQKKNVHFLDKSSEISFHSSNSILNVKRKIWLITGIPIWAQYMWIYDSGEHVKLAYDADYDDLELDINIFQVLDQRNIKNFHDIPINNRMLMFHDLIQIKSHEMDVSLNSFLDKSRDIFIVSALPFLQHIKSISSLSKTDNTAEIIFNGFISNYWPMISPVFYRGIIAESNIRSLHPSMFEQHYALKREFSLEHHFVHERMKLLKNTSLLKSIVQMTKISISRILITPKTNGETVDELIRLRYLFDIFVLDKDIDGIIFKTTISNQTYLFHKLLVSNKSNNIFTSGAEFESREQLVFRIRYMFDNKIDYIYISVFSNGDHKMHCHFDMIQQLSLQSIFNISAECSKVLFRRISKLSKFVMTGKFKFRMLSRSNSVCGKINIQFSHNIQITKNNSRQFKKLLYRFTKSGFISIRQTERGLFQGSLNKGVFSSHKSTSERFFYQYRNTYEFLKSARQKQKYKRMFLRLHNISIKYRYADVIIRVSNVNDNELFNVYLTVLTFFHLLRRECNVRKKEKKRKSGKPFSTSKAMRKVDEQGVSKTYRHIKKLREFDPKLYILPKKYVYSRICQKKMQPVVVEPEELSKLSKEKRARVLKFWNYTTSKPAHYLCDSKTHPYVKFITDRHPQKYCLPCCFKNPINRNNPDIQKRFNNCIKTHVFEPNGEKSEHVKKTIRFIPKYSKNVAANRIAQLPTELHVYLNVSNQDSLKYYVYGVDQSVLGAMNNGVLLSVLFCLNVTFNQFQKDLRLFFKQKPYMFCFLSKGQVAFAFDSTEKFLHYISTIHDFSNLSPSFLTKVSWTLLFKELVELIYKVNVIVLHSINGRITYNLQPSVINISQVFTTNRLIFLVQNSRRFVPVVLASADRLWKSGQIQKKIFACCDPISEKISLLINFFIRNSKTLSDGFQNQTILSMYNIIAFVKKTNYSLNTYMLDNKNDCYGVILEHRSQLIYVPITQSIIHPHMLPKSTKRSLQVRELGSQASVLKFLFDYAKFHKERLKVQYWFLFGRTVIGCVIDNIPFYFKAQKYQKRLHTRLRRLKYHPLQTNKILHKYRREHEAGKELDFAKSYTDKELAYAIYNVNIYSLLKLVLCKRLVKQKNQKFRKMIVNVINGIVRGKSKELHHLRMLDSMSNRDKALVLKVVNAKKKKKTKQMNLTKHIRNLFFDAEIDSLFVWFSKLSTKQQRAKITAWIKPFVYIVRSDADVISNLDIKQLKHSNFLFHCNANDNFYCKSKRILVTQQKFASLVSIFFAEMQKKRGLRTIVFASTILGNVNKFKFIYRDSEIIYVEKID